MRSIRPGHKVSTAQKPGCAEVCSCSRHWPCLFARHGAGRKDLRTIELQPWQRVIVRAYPGQLARGLFHSDGYRELTAYMGISRMATGGRSIRGICLPMNPGTFSGSVGAKC